MTDHPALRFKYDIVHYTRGNGVEVGGGQLYAHFRQPGDAEPLGELDFVFVVNQPADAWLDLVKPGGHVVSVQGDELKILCRMGSASESMFYEVDEKSMFPAKSACVCRYGGFGDSLQAANVLPQLKREGFFVVFMTTPRGYEVLKHDPHIDAWLIQDDNQVPNEELVYFWHCQALRFERFVNLSESVEGSLLAYPGRANHAWPHEVRHQMLDRNYLEFTSALAGVPYVSEGRFYATTEEGKAARMRLADLKNELAGELRMGERAADRFNVLWCLSGSSVHKFYPLQDVVIERLLSSNPDAVLFFVGDDACRILEAGWEKHPRIRCLSGELGIRDTLALAQEVDCVVGPETGVLNAVAFEAVSKVILLSHSSPENLTKHWVNAEVLTPANTACYPCHRLHTTSAFCKTNEDTGAAICQHDIAPERVYDAIHAAYCDWLDLQPLRVTG
jgi:ADP-heptose:LPS heptosyltransferase